ncbi:nicotinate-nucleotide adenylyltransferase [Legionella spiritensis]|uniref:Probable nicotinate-nucleotide adenylyltransferase n=1 Tax=Legionella spiritensis TaxID=452 RepID=A0A0W0Z4P3_LEGSP|nr:nicotinate-nucleotide adenylyltransferase [Legionella spiritensis]KTD64122.1 nicotinate-nucleotide adenylyltransferase NadD [Legionella spiritensis]SNV37942.1 nicotinate-nucleotide adenylyltransferase NadD [Legionella spiritensis]
MNNLIIYGGSFDPIHYGHINTALNVQQHFNFQAFYFLPCRIPVLKGSTHASSQHRANMIQLVIDSLPSNRNFHLDYSELRRRTPSYMVTTLENFRKKLGWQTSITLLLGLDTFSQLPKWHQWQRLFELANLLVIDREEHSNIVMPETLQMIVKKHEHREEKALCSRTHGIIHRFNAGHFRISSTCIREQLAKGESIDGKTPDSVINYIRQNNLYQNGSGYL